MIGVRRLIVISKGHDVILSWKSLQVIKGLGYAFYSYLRLRSKLLTKMERPPRSYDDPLIRCFVSDKRAENCPNFSFPLCYLLSYYFIEIQIMRS